ncbi:MAG: hypothetical protein WDO73_31695 [Ignavibacteriota bacterium]
MLSDSEFDTQVAADGLEALEKTRHLDADVIVADLVMPRNGRFRIAAALERTRRPHTGDRAHGLRQYGEGAVRRS